MHGALQAAAFGNQRPDAIPARAGVHVGNILIFSDSEEDEEDVRSNGNRTLVRHFRVLDPDADSSEDDGTFEVEEDEDYVESEWLVTDDAL